MELTDTVRLCLEVSDFVPFYGSNLIVRYVVGRLRKEDNKPCVTGVTIIMVWKKNFDPPKFTFL